MDLRQLRTAVVLAEELHFGRAAKRLHVVQSAVSQTIKGLEADVGAPLFTRTKRTVRLTEAGEALVARARKLLDDVREIPVHVRSVASGEAGQLRLRFVMASVLTDVPRTIARFKARYPGVSVRALPEGSRAQLEALRAGECDVGFMAMVNVQRDLDLAHKVVATFPMVAVLPSKHPLAKRRTIQLRELAKEPLVFLAQLDEPEIHQRFRQHCIAAGFDPDFAMEVQHTDALLAFVAAGLAISCVPGFIDRLRHRGVVTVPLSPTIQAGIIARWDEERISATGRNFIAMLPDIVR
jgi:DNA-binding transcriptional LysR family regulator